MRVSELLWLMSVSVNAAGSTGSGTKVKGVANMGDDPALEEARADVSRAGWSIFGNGYSTYSVTLTFHRDSTPEHREIVERQTFGKTKIEAIRAFLKELTSERDAE